MYAHLVKCRLVVFVAACYHPQVGEDIPCSPNGTCPPPQRCDLAQAPPICVLALHDAAPSDADLQWGAPQPIAYMPTGSDDDPTLTADMLELVFNRANDLWVTTRPAIDQPWSDATPIAELNTASLESTPEIAPDGLTIYFSSNRTGSTGVDVWMATRKLRTDPWTAPVLVPELESASTDRCATPGADPDVMVMASNRGGTAQKFDLYVTTRMMGGAWSKPVAITELNTPFDDTAPMLSADDLTIYFFSNRSGNEDLYVAHRPDTASPFGPATPITELDTASGETDPWISPDDHHLVFARSNVLYEATR